MSGFNLVVYKNGKLAFTNVIVRQNRTYFKLGWMEMINLKEASLNIMLDNQAVMMINLGSNGHGDDIIRGFGPLGVKLNPMGDISELSKTEYGSEITSFRTVEPTRPDKVLVVEEQRYVRSNNWMLEVAAATASFIYDDVGTIFEEAYRSCGLTPPPFYVGNIKDIRSSLGSIYMTMEMMMLIEKDKSFNIIEEGKKGRVYEKYKKDIKLLEEDVKHIHSKPEMLTRIIASTILLMDLELKNAVIEPEVKDVKTPEKAELEHGKNADPSDRSQDRTSEQAKKGTVSMTGKETARKRKMPVQLRVVRGRSAKARGKASAKSSPRR